MCTGLRWTIPPGLVFEAHRLVYHLTLGLSVIKKKKVEVYPRQADHATKAHQPREVRHLVLLHTRLLITFADFYYFRSLLIIVAADFCATRSKPYASSNSGQLAD